MTQIRVAVTGLGVISPIGTGADEFWNAMMEGRSGVRRITAFDPAPFESQIAGEVPDFDATAYLDRKDVRRNDRCAHFAVAASRMALDDARLQVTPALRDDLGVVIGTGSGGAITWEAQHQLLLERGSGRVSPFFVPMMMHNGAAAVVSMLIGARGPNFSIASACATGGHAIGEAMRKIQRGDATAMLCGGTEAALTPLSLAGFCAEKALSTRNDAPEKAVRPFDLHRDGFVMGEGAGVVVLEAWEHAERRGARIYAELAGYGASADAFHITQPDPEGEGAALAMRRALRDAGLAPHEIGYINAHGTSTPLNDKFETIAIKRVFGDAAPRVPVSSTKSMTGHLLGAAGGVELIAAVLAVARGWLPPTINYETPDPDCDLDYIPNVARAARITTAMSNGFGFGGHNSILIVRSPS
ncbi:MAG TPA: beta-ketoacyl-ACP synthase II [bacterium]|nr:beta-ketoacyl-ACP synthase II [bacterium]